MKTGSRRARRRRPALSLTVAAALVLVAGGAGGQGIRGSLTYRPEVVGRVGVAATGRHFAAEAALRMLARGGNAIDAGVAATFAAAVSEISHFGLGGEVPIVLFAAERGGAAVISGQGTAPAAATAEHFRRLQGIPGSGPAAGTIPAVVDALALALRQYGTLSLTDTLGPAIALADGFPWYDFLTYYLRPELERMRSSPSGAHIYLTPGGGIPATGSLFRQQDLAATLRALADEEQQHRADGRERAIAAARDRFYRGDIGQRIARAALDAGGLMTAADLAAFTGRVEPPTRGTFTTRHGTFEVLKTGFWGQGPVVLQALAILQGFDLERMGHNSTEYVHTVTEALKLALADRDAFYGDPLHERIPMAGLLADAYARERRALIDPLRASGQQRPGDPWRFEPGGGGSPGRGAAAPAIAGARAESPDTTCISVADARGNLFAAAPSSAWFFGGTFIAGDTGVPLGNRMQAFVLDPGHPNVVRPGKRPRTTLSPTVVLRDGRPWLAMTGPGGDSQDQQALQVLLNLAVFGLSAQEAVEAPRFNSLHHEASFGEHRFAGGALQAEDRIPRGVTDALARLGHRVDVVGPFMMDSGVVAAGVHPRYGTLFAAADVRRQRFAAGW